MADSPDRHWHNIVADFIALISLGVAILALVQSHNASRKANETSEASLSIQQRKFDREESPLNVTDIQVQLSLDDDTNTIYYPPRLPASELDPIPIDVWRSHVNRYAIFGVQNRGNDPFFINYAGISISNDKFQPAQSFLAWCADDNNAPAWSASCTNEVPPKQERLFSFALRNDLINLIVDRDLNAHGISICAEDQINRVSCVQGETALPQGAFEGPAPLK